MTYREPEYWQDRAAYEDELSAFVERVHPLTDAERSNSRNWYLSPFNSIPGHLDPLQRVTEGN